MITKRQIEELASYFRIDQTSVFREYLQLQFLNYFYQQREAENIYFKGGTAIHLFFNSPRFSEDLDFSTIYSKEKITKIIKRVEAKLIQELPSVKIFSLYQGKKSIRFRLKYSAVDFRYPFVIRLDFTEKDKPFGKAVSSTLVTRFPMTLFPIVNHFSIEEILAEKVRAFLTRGKGRDVFDLWFLLEKGIIFDSKMVEQKLKSVGRKFEKQKLIDKIRNFSQKRLERDLNKFLPQSHRKIVNNLKQKLNQRLASGNW